MKGFLLPSVLVHFSVDKYGTFLDVRMMNTVIIYVVRRVWTWCIAIVVLTAMMADNA